MTDTKKSWAKIGAQPAKNPKNECDKCGKKITGGNTCITCAQKVNLCIDPSKITAHTEICSIKTKVVEKKMMMCTWCEKDVPENTMKLRVGDPVCNDCATGTECEGCAHMFPKDQLERYEFVMLCPKCYTRDVERYGEPSDY